MACLRKGEGRLARPALTFSKRHARRSVVVPIRGAWVPRPPPSPHRTRRAGRPPRPPRGGGGPPPPPPIRLGWLPRLRHLAAFHAQPVGQRRAGLEFAEVLVQPEDQLGHRLEPHAKLA